MLCEAARRNDIFLLGGARIIHPSNSPQRRLKHSRPDAGATLEEAPGDWADFDFDNAPTEIDPVVDPEGAVEALVRARLPPPFHDVSYIFQFTSSAGLKPGFVSAHIYFALQDALSNAECKRLIRQQNIDADPSVFCCTQPHYIANPIFENMEDPLPRRVGVVRKTNDFVCLPEKILGAIRATNTTRKAKSGKKSLKRPIAARTLDEAQAVLEQHAHRIRAVPRGAPRHPIVNTEAFRAADLVGLLDRDTIEEALVAAARSMDDPKSEAEARDEVKRALDDGVMRWNMAETTGTFELTENDKGRPHNNLGNLLSVLAMSSEWEGCLGYDERAARPMFLSEPPFAEAISAPCTTLPRPLEDADLVRIAATVGRIHGFTPKPALLHGAVEVVARRRSFDPVEVFLRSLPPWDGIERVDTALTRLWGAEASSYTGAVSRVLFLSAVARGLVPGCKVDTMVIFEGAQGTQKSSSIRLLFGRSFFSEGLSPLSSKDSKLELLDTWAIEIAELDAFSRRESAEVKAYISKQDDHFRTPYARLAERVRRRVVFIGTTNEATYLQDATGGRRFLPIRVGHIDLEGIAKQREQLFAEAVSRFDSGEPHWLTSQEDFLAKEEQEKRYAPHPWESQILQGLTKLDMRDFTPSWLILNIVLEVPKGTQERRHEMLLGQVMPRLGYTKVRVPASIAKDRPHGWFRDVGEPGLSTAKAMSAAFSRIGGK